MKKIICAILLAVFAISIFPLYSTASVVALVSNEPEPATVKAAIAEFKSLSKKERKERVKELKYQVKKWKKSNKLKAGGDVEPVILIILAVLLPPLAVYLHQGEINTKFWIALLLTLLAVINLFLILPAIIYALLVVTDTI